MLHSCVSQLVYGHVDPSLDLLVYALPFPCTQMFLGNNNKVYILDKTENNPVNVTGKYGTHPAWAVEYDIDTNTCEQTIVGRARLTFQIAQWMSTRIPFVPAAVS